MLSPTRSSGSSPRPRPSPPRSGSSAGMRSGSSRSGARSLTGTSPGRSRSRARRAPAGTTFRRSPSSSSGRSTGCSAATGACWPCRSSGRRPGSGRSREASAREAGGGAVLVVSALVLAGSLPAVVVVSGSVFSLAFFPLLLALLESEARAPSRRLWLSPPAARPLGKPARGGDRRLRPARLLPRVRAGPAGARAVGTRPRRRHAGAVCQPDAVADAALLPRRLREPGRAARRGAVGAAGHARPRPRARRFRARPGRARTRLPRPRCGSGRAWH